MSFDYRDPEFVTIESDFTEKELLKIAEALECDLNIEFTSKDTEEKL